MMTLMSLLSLLHMALLPVLVALTGSRVGLLSLLTVTLAMKLRSKVE